MAPLNANIILAGAQPDVVGAFDRGQQAGARGNAIQQQNRLAQVFQTQGPGIAAGDPRALNALAAIDPTMSLGVQQTRLGMDATRQGMRIDEQNVSLRAAELASGLDARQREQMAAAFERGAGMLAAAQTPEQRQMLLSQPGFQEAAQALGIPPEALTVENADTLIGAAVGAAGIMKGREGGGSAKDQEISRTMRAWGVDYATAQGIADGVLKVSQDPTTREIMVTNLATGQTFAPTVSQGMPGQPPAQEQPTPSTTQQPAGTPTFGDAFQGAANSFGFQGVARGLANTGADALGFEVPFPEDQQTRQDFEVLGESLVNDFASAYGRQPPSWLLQNIAGLVPQAGRPFEGPQRAQTKLVSIARDMESRRRVAQESLRRRLTPAERQEALALIAGIDATLARVSSALEGFGGTPGQSGNQTSNGVTWSIEE